MGGLFRGRGPRPQALIVGTSSSSLREMSTGNSEYYARLNVESGASEEEIRAAFKRLMLIYHPNKFVDSSKEKSAKKLYLKIKEAYDVLSNPVTRAIYDKRGREGIRREMDIIKRTALPLELLEKYEEVYQLWEERTYIQEAQPNSRIEVDVDARTLITKGQLVFLVTNIRGFQSVDARMGQDLKAHLSGNISAGSSRPSGGITASFQHSRHGQTWRYNVHLSKKPTLGVNYIRKLSSRTKLSLHGDLSFAPSSFLKFPPKCSMSFDHKLSENLSTSVTVHNVDLSSIQSSVTYRFNDYLYVVGSVDVGRSGSAVRAQIGADLTESCTFKMGTKVGTSGASVSYGLQHSLMKLTKLGSFVSLSPQGIHLKLTLHRTRQSYSVRFHLSDNISLLPVLCASVVPVFTYMCISAVAIFPLLRQQREWERKKELQDLETAAKEDKKEALATLELMKESAERIMQIEQAKLGLVINEACYGKMSVAGNRRINPSPSDDVIDVRLQLQCLIQDSKLIVPNGSKSELNGFYDPSVGQAKWLYIAYDFRGFQHEVVVSDSQQLAIPKESHRIGSPSFYNEEF